MILRTGIDLVEISRFAELQEPLRTRFVQRVFTADEIADCRGSNEKLAGRFAVKEAAAKALGCGIGEVSWQEIEVQKLENGQPQLILHGRAQELAQELGLTQWSISLTHTATQAAAVTVAVGEGQPLE